MTSENCFAEGTSLEQAEVVCKVNKIENFMLSMKKQLVGLITLEISTKLTQTITNKDVYGRLHCSSFTVFW
jgi:hypothetical protein